MGSHQPAIMSYPYVIEAGKPVQGFGGARTLYNDHRDTHPETFKHLKAKLAQKSGGGPGFKSQEQMIEETKARVAERQRLNPPAEEEIEAKEREKKIGMLRRKCGVGGRRTPSGGFFT